MTKYYTGDICYQKNLTFPALKSFFSGEKEEINYFLHRCCNCVNKIFLYVVIFFRAIIFIQSSQVISQASFEKLFMLIVPKSVTERRHDRKVKVRFIYVTYVGKVPVRGGTFSGPSALLGRVASSPSRSFISPQSQSYFCCCAGSD